MEVKSNNNKYTLCRRTIPIIYLTSKKKKKENKRRASFQIVYSTKNKLCYLIFLLKEAFFFPFIFLKCKNHNFINIKLDCKYSENLITWADTYDYKSWTTHFAINMTVTQCLRSKYSEFQTDSVFEVVLPTYLGTNHYFWMFDLTNLLLKLSYSLLNKQGHANRLLNIFYIGAAGYFSKNSFLRLQEQFNDISYLNSTFYLHHQYVIAL